ncbi:MAG: hypothetical protein WA428_05275 [Candidatus Cybelea sp.]
MFFVDTLTFSNIGDKFVYQGKLLIFAVVLLAVLHRHCDGGIA